MDKLQQEVHNELAELREKVAKQEHNSQNQYFERIELRAAINLSKIAMRDKQEVR